MSYEDENRNRWEDVADWADRNGIVSVPELQARNRQRDDYDRTLLGLPRSYFVPQTSDCTGDEEADKLALRALEDTLDETETLFWWNANRYMEGE